MMISFGDSRFRLSILPDGPIASDLSFCKYYMNWTSMPIRVSVLVQLVKKYSVLRFISFIGIKKTKSRNALKTLRL
ncbi:MAG TPA: hypothetical protein VEC36_01435 [Patescibacteria group bacterium]|nr:hypothetical protein [Patescibacteria group bacterium]